MRSKVKYLAALLSLGYVALLAVLLLAERSDPNASITSFSDAFWYSVVTLSTVGYGDLYPVTVLGRIIGVCFVLMSIGVLSLVLSFVINLLTGKMLPAFRLWKVRKRQWYVFDEINEESLALAESLAGEFPDAAILFPQSEGRSDDYYTYPDTIARTVAEKKGHCTLFFMGQNSQTANYKNAMAAQQLGFPVYCCTSQVPDALPEGLTVFNRYDCCAREYWRREALKGRENVIIIIGDGAYATSLLEQGLMVNVFDRSRQVKYHVFGDWSEFRRNHPNLGQTVSISGKDERMDALYFHDAPWNEDGELLLQAHRIILCGDRDEDNLEVLGKLRTYFPVDAAVHIRLGEEIPGENVFGLNRQVYTADMVIRGETHRMAKLIHEIYAEGSGWTAPSWEQLNPFLRQSNLAAADHLLTKIRYLLDDDGITQENAEICAGAYRCYCETKAERCETYREMEHRRWMRFHSLYNWTYAPVRDNKLRRHPAMRPYDELTLQEQIKDDYSWELLAGLAERL